MAALVSAGDITSAKNVLLALAQIDHLPVFPDSVVNVKAGTDINRYANKCYDAIVQYNAELTTDHSIVAKTTFV